jgi:CheY-like chemotaxis protein
MRTENGHRTPWLHLEWIERGGPAVEPVLQGAQDSMGGFGTSFIRETARYQLRGQAELTFEPAGLHCTIDIPLERASVDHVDPPEWSVSPARSQGSDVHDDGVREPVINANGEPGPRRVLVVEDDLLVARSIGSHLQSLGCEVIGPASTSADACALLKSGQVDAAILDINLSAGSSAPVARALAGRSTPFVFVTGYSNLKTLPDDLRGHRVLCKPVDRDSLGRALREMVNA